MPSHPSFDHVVTAMRAQVDAIHSYRADARRARDPEAVHRMRVAVRRLRAILRASGSLSDDDLVEGLRRELKWLGIALGRVRDLDRAKALQDVLGAHQDAVIAQRCVRRAFGTAPEVRALVRQVTAQQDERRDEARKAFFQQWPKLKRRGRRAWE